MGNESGTWVMYGVAPDDPECIHTVDEAIEYINEKPNPPAMLGRIE